MVKYGLELLLWTDTFTQKSIPLIARAKELGLELCPAEVGPQLRLQYKDQPNGEWILIAMEPITDSDGDLLVFRVKCLVSELWLNSYDGNPDAFWNPDSQWVFVRPRSDLHSVPGFLKFWFL